MSRAFSLIHMFEEQGLVGQPQPVLATGFTLSVLFDSSGLPSGGVEEIAEKYKAKILSKEIRFVFEYVGKDAVEVRKELIEDLKSLGGTIL